MFCIASGLLFFLSVFCCLFVLFVFKMHHVDLYLDREYGERFDSEISKEKVEGIEGGKKDNGVSSNIEIIECSYIHQTQ